MAELQPVGKIMKNTALGFAKIMIKKQFPALEGSEFEIKEELFPCGGCGAVVIPEYLIKRPQDEGFKKVPLDPVECLPCQNKALAIASVEKSKRLKSEFLTDKFWIIPPELKGKTLENYVPADAEQGKALKRAAEYVKEYKVGKSYNLIFRGTYGGGKSHLLKGIAEVVKGMRRKDEDGHMVPVTVGYLEAETLFDMLKDTWKKNSVTTEMEIIRNVIALDFLVIDDIGTESGEWAGKKLFEIINGRQGKPTAYTTNFMDFAELAKRYDMNGGKIVSRLHNNTEIVDLVTKDMREELSRGAY